jgi:hypothetical protein
VQRIIESVCDLQRYLSPADLAGREQVEYRLGSFKSRIAMELLQVAVRKQACVFGLDHELVAANVAVDAKSLHVDVRQLNTLNDRIQDLVWKDAFFQIRLLQRFHTCKQRMDIVASRFHACARDGEATADDLIEYLDLVTSYHELGVLKFSFPDRLARREIAATLRGDQRLQRDLFRPQGVSLFYELYVQRLRLAWCRLTQAHDNYLRAVAQFRDRYGFLSAEDMDFREHDTLDQLDAEIGRVIQLYRSDAGAIQSRLEELEEQSAEAQVERRRAWNEFFTLAGKAESRLFSLNLLALCEQLISHEETNRLSKMRFLRDVSLLLERRGLDVFQATILDAVASTGDASDKSPTRWS